jgi:hypothetical protein
VQVPTSGMVTFALEPSNIVVASGYVQSDPSLGSAYISIVVPADVAINNYGWGQRMGAYCQRRTRRSNDLLAQAARAFPLAMCGSTTIMGDKCPPCL